MKFNAKRFFAWLGIGLAVVAAILVVVLEFAAGPAVKGLAKTVGPLVLGTEIAISDADIHLFSGKIDMGGVVIGPPEGFKENLFELDSIRIDMDTMSLLRKSGPIVIRDITIESPVVTYEVKGLGDNLHAVLDKLGAADEGKTADKEEKASADEPARKVVIERFNFEGGRVRVSLPGAPSVPIPLPTIELADIGRKGGGVTGIEATFEVFQSIVVGTVSAAAGIVGDVGGLAVDGVKAVGGLAVDVAGDVGGLAVDGTKAVGGLAVDGAKSLGKVIGGIFSSDEEKADDAGTATDDGTNGE
jgi:uncharacterized protein involved in outer membrane biogenesis